MTQVPTPPTVGIRTCSLCEATCGLEITTQGEQVIRIRGDRDDVFSRGFICPKGSALKDLHEDPDRLRLPIIRTGNSWEQVSWDEAFEVVASGLQRVIREHGNDAVGAYFGNPSVHGMAVPFFGRSLLKALKSKNFFSAATVDQMPKHISSGLMFGHPDLIPVPDIDRTAYLLMLGANPHASNGSLATAPDWPGRMTAIQQRGGTIVTVDPRLTKTAAASDQHIAIRPGTDALWLFALAQVIVSEDRTDLGRLGQFTKGFQEFATATLPFTPEAVAKATGIGPETTKRIAREFASADSAAAYGRIGTHTSEFGTLASWLVDVLNVITGNLDSVGGAMFPLHAHSSPRPKRGFKTGRWQSRATGRPEVRGEFPVAAIVEEIEEPGEGQMRAFITVAGNPVLSIPDSTRTAAALEKLEFMVSVDMYLNETTRHADVILPVPSPLEREHFDLAFYALSVENVANYSPATFAPPEGNPPEWEILAKLAAIVSGAPSSTPASVVDDATIGSVVGAAVANPESPVFGRDPIELIDLAEGRGPARILDFLLRSGPYGDHFAETKDGLSLAQLKRHPHGLHFGPLKPRFPQALATPDGEIDLAPQALIDDAVRLVHELITPAPELVLIGRRDIKSNNSWMHNIDRLTRTRNKCTLLIHPDDADSYGLSTSATVTVSSDTGSVQAEVQVSETMMPGVVSLPHGWGHDLAGTNLQIAATRPGVNSNILASRVVDPLSGNARLTAIPVSLSRS